MSLPITPAAIETIDLTLAVFGAPAARALEQITAAAAGSGAELEPILVSRLNRAIENASGRERTALITLRSHVVAGRLPLIVERAQLLAGDAHI